VPPFETVEAIFFQYLEEKLMGDDGCHQNSERAIAQIDLIDKRDYPSIFRGLMSSFKANQQTLKIYKVQFILPR